MTDNGHYQFSSKQGDDIYLVVSPLADGLDTFLERAKALSAGIPKPSGTTADEIAANLKKPSPQGEKSIPVESIQLAAGGDHPRWVVKGGKFKKFGITCWPETLEAAGMMNYLDPLKDNKPQANWTAFYVEGLNDKGEMKPDKVTRLVKG